VTAVAESTLRSGHPWLFADSIREQSRSGLPGDLAVVYDRRDRFLALGLFDPDSPIRMRVLQAGKPEKLDAAWWARRLQRALALRASLFNEQTNGYRLVNGESDGWPGFVLDRYNDTLVLKLYTSAWLPHLERTVSLIRDLLQPKRIVLRVSRNIQRTAEVQLANERKVPDKNRDAGGGVTGEAHGRLLAGPGLRGPVLFLETGLRFEADVLRGQKTGFFLDQRENRRRVEALAGGRSVLNAFSFSGGFSLYAARGGARSVTDLDISAHALESSCRNFALNAGDPKVATCMQERIQGEAFAWLSGNAVRKFDLVILDPPSLARREAERAGALRAYSRLAGLAITHLRRDGVLVACSCSAHVSAGEFFETARRIAARSGRRYQEIGTTGHAADHPTTFKEAEYLKAIYLNFEA
jgi:23S rRNA (cytosine1962-C5)-methyltransferase